MLDLLHPLWYVYCYCPCSVHVKELMWWDLMRIVSVITRRHLTRNSLILWLLESFCYLPCNDPGVSHRCTSCFMGASARIGLHHSPFWIVVFFHNSLCCTKNRFLGEEWRLCLSVGIGTNVYNVVREYTGLVSSSHRFTSKIHDLTIPGYLARFPVPSMDGS